VADFQTSEVDAELLPVNMGPWSCVFWQVSVGWTTLNETTLAKNRNYEYGLRLKIKIDILFCRDNTWTVAIRQTKLCSVKDHGHSYNFIWIIILIDSAFQYGCGSKLWGYVEFSECHTFVNYLIIIYVI
jgi:hypothetical protein